MSYFPAAIATMLPASLRILSLSALLLFTAACSPETPPAPPHADAATISINDAWIRQPPPGAAVAGAYLRLHNPGAQDDRLLAVETDAAERVEIHDMQMEAGLMKMREVKDGLRLPGGETTQLAPGGLHLMLMAPKAEWALGDEIAMQLTFEHAPAQTVVFQVRALMDADDSTPQHGQHMH